jgi:hypothetical protein
MEGVDAGIREVRHRLARLLREPDDAAGLVELHDTPGRWPFGVEHRERGYRAVYQVGVDECPQIEIGQVVGVARKEEFLPRHPLPVGGERSGAAKQFRLEERTDRRRLGTHGKVLPYHIRQVVKIDENLVDSGAVEGVKPDVEHWPVVDEDHALRNGVGDRPQPTPDPRGQEKCLHRLAFRTTPRASIRSFAAASTPSRPSMPSSHSA